MHINEIYRLQTVEYKIKGSNPNLSEPETVAETR